MNAVISKLKQFRVLIIIVVLALIGFVYFSSAKKASPFETASVVRGDVLQEVSVTGKVVPDAEVNLSFERSGKVASVPISVGALVHSGDVLVRLDTSELEASLAGARANLEFERANLAALKSGARPEDVAVSKAKVESGAVSVAEATKTVFDKLGVSLTVADDVVHNTADQFYRNPRTRNPELTFPVSDAKLLIYLNSERVVIEDLLATWSQNISEMETQGNVDDALELCESNLNQIKTYIDSLSTAVNALTPSSALTQTTIDGWRLTISSARSSLNTAISGVLTSGEKYRTATEAKKIAENELTLKLSGATLDQVSAQEAKVKVVQATIGNYQAQIEKAVLRAPFAGVVTMQNAKQGATAPLNTPVVALQSSGKWKIEANIPEADIAKVKIGNHAQITFDAYGSDTFFSGTIVLIDPAETVIEGVATYKVTLLLDKDDERVRSGMTANIDIETDKREGVLKVPTRAVVTQSGKKVVRVPSVDGVSTTDAVVKTGLRGSDGTIEILEGLSEGEKVVTYVE